MAPTPTDRTPPNVPNHQMVRIIGRGAYGEIWLARSLTGTWCAVKIVDRQTFQSERAFEREFDGMAKFEPISRSHDGFVDILHVGRDEAGGFFYYVMELADDHVAGTRVDPANYVPKTLKSELARRSRLLVDECLSIGLSLTDALGALHRNGLVHRDIKPANIIFVGGKPKIADIGLVASTGQLSYVGTEGYVPPEGPGSAPADLYSLGKVLYEIAMGKDRLDFPAINSQLDELPDKERLLCLNEVVLRACANASRRALRERGANARRSRAPQRRTAARVAKPAALAVGSRCHDGARARRRVLLFLRTERAWRSFYRNGSSGCDDRLRRHDEAQPRAIRQRDDWYADGARDVDRIRTGGSARGSHRACRGASGESRARAQPRLGPHRNKTTGRDHRVAGR
jgi:serine/threonine protein kinase